MLSMSSTFAANTNTQTPHPLPSEDMVTVHSKIGRHETLNLSPKTRSKSRDSNGWMNFQPNQGNTFAPFKQSSSNNHFKISTEQNESILVTPHMNVVPDQSLLNYSTLQYKNMQQRPEEMIMDFNKIEAFDQSGGTQNRMNQLQDSQDCSKKSNNPRSGKQIISDSRHLRKQVHQPIQNFTHNRKTSEDSNTLEIKRKI